MKFTALAMLPALLLTLLVVLLESVSLAIPAILFSLMWASWILTLAVVELYWAARIARYSFRKNGTH